MCIFKKKFKKMIKKQEEELAKLTWPIFVTKYIGCELCQHYDKKDNACKNGHQDILEERHGLPCDDIMPNELGKRKK